MDDDLRGQYLYSGQCVTKDFLPRNRASREGMCRRSAWKSQQTLTFLLRMGDSGLAWKTPVARFWSLGPHSQQSTGPDPASCEACLVATGGVT
jgi:hypothetical protein